MAQRRDFPTKDGGFKLSGASLHEAVRAELYKRITTGVYKPGDVIASTAQLGEEFDVSPITVKRAVRDLQTAGLLTSVPGKGTFVKAERRLVIPMGAWLSSLDLIRKLGFEPRIELASITKESIVDPAFAIFDLPEGPQLCVRKVIYADDTPVMYDITYLSPRVPNAIIEELGERSVVAAFVRNKIQLKAEKLVVDAAPASLEAQATFGIPSGYPMLRRLYHIKTNKPGITVTGVAASPFDRLVCSMDLPASKVAKMGPLS